MDLQFIAKHASDMLQVVSLLHAAALVIVNITPTPRDNEILNGVQGSVKKGYRLIEIFAGIFNSGKVKT